MQTDTRLPTYPSVRALATAFRLIGLVYLALAAVALLLPFTGGWIDTLTGIVAAASCLLCMLILLAASEMLAMIRDTAINSFRTADAVEQLTASAGGQYPPPAARIPANFPVAELPVSDLPSTQSASVEHPKPPDGRMVICGMCGAKLKLPADGHLKPGDRSRCPKCGGMVAV